jgi:hypothetical protein
MPAKCEKESEERVRIIQIVVLTLTVSLSYYVGVARFELATSDSRSQHATNCATPRILGLREQRKRKRKNTLVML